MNKGKLIVFEGGEGCGKTSHIKKTKTFLETKSFDVLITHEPGGTKFGSLVREIILNKDLTINPISELFLFLAVRQEHVSKVIKPALEENKVVLCDRFTASTLAYQLGAQKIPNPKLVKSMEAYARDELLPDITIFLDMDPVIGKQRKKDQLNDATTKFDEAELSFHQAVRDYFQKLSNQNNWFTFNAEKTLDEVQKQINELLTKELL